MASSPARASTWRSYLELVRPPNVATALGDVLAGFAVAGLPDWSALPWVLVSTAALYAGGITLNDVFDRTIDATERPERPIPSGRIPAGSARILGFGLLLVGVIAACVTGRWTGVVALSIAVLVIAYDTLAKSHAVMGPINMGACRGMNLLLGAAVAGPGALYAALPAAVLVMTYIAAVTLISRGEVEGGVRRTGTVAVGIVVVVLAGLVALAITGISLVARTGALALTGWLAFRIVPAFQRARRAPAAAVVRHAVKTGVLSLTLVDAVIATSYAGMIYGLALLAAAFVAGRLARAFAVT